MLEIILIQGLSLVASVFYFGFKAGSYHRLKKDIRLFNKFLQKKIKREQDEV